MAAGDENSGTAEHSTYTGSSQTIKFTVSMPDEFNGNRDNVYFLLSKGSENIETKVVWNSTDKGFVATVTAVVVDTGSYVLTVSADGMTSDSETWVVDSANLSEVVLDLASEECEIGKTPQIKSAMLGDVDVADIIASELENGAMKVEYRTIWNQSGTNTAPANFVEGQEYFFVLVPGSESNFGGWTGEEDTPKFTATESTSTSSKAAFESGKALVGIDQDNKTVEADDKGRFSVVSDGENALYVVPTSVMPKGAANAVEVVLADEENIANNFFKDLDNDGEYDAATESTPIANLTELKTAGDYLVKVTAKDENSVYAGAYCYVPMTVKAFAFDSVEVFNLDADNDGDEDAGADKQLENSSFVFDGAAQRLGLVVDGEDATSKVTNVVVYASNGKQVAAATSLANLFTNKGDKYKNADTYTLTGMIGSTPIKATFTVEQLDLSEALVFVPELVFGTNAGYASAQSKTTINGKKIADIDANITFAVTPAITGVGSYKATVTAPVNDANIIGSGSVESNVVKKDVSADLQLTYGGIAVGASEKFDVTGTNAFDVSKLGLDYKTDELDSSEYSLVITDSKNNIVESGFKPGETYTVTARLIPDAEFSMGGTAKFSFTVENGTIQAADVTVTYKGDVVSSTIASPYTGKNVASDVKVAIKVGKKTLVEGTDYNLVLKNKAGDVVEEAVAAGEYTLSIEGITYNASAVSDIKIIVGDMQVTGLRVQPSDMGVIAWTGEAVTPVIEYTLDSQAKIDAGTAEWTVLPSDYYVAKYIDEDDEAVSEVVDEGDYKVTITPSTKIENMTLPAENVLEFTVSKTVAGFVDVSTSAWYANVVAKADELGYMTGISGTAMFAPNATITRAEVAEVFAKMAGLDLDKDKTYPTKFADVASDAWFAQSVAWASQAGIVGGYEGTDLFGSFDNATREQVATMIYRYAAVAGLDTSVEDEAKALSAYSDADQLTFGKTAMAWCVEQGIMGVDTDVLNPLANMSRAEMAATAVRVQPEAIA